MLSASTILMAYGAAIGMPPITWIAPLTAFFVNLVLNVLLIPALGIAGASMSSSVAYTIVLVLGAVGLHRVRDRAHGH